MSSTESERGRAFFRAALNDGAISSINALLDRRDLISYTPLLYLWIIIFLPFLFLLFFYLARVLFSGSFTFSPMMSPLLSAIDVHLSMASSYSPTPSSTSCSSSSVYPLLLSRIFYRKHAFIQDHDHVVQLSQMLVTIETLGFSFRVERPKYDEIIVMGFGKDAEREKENDEEKGKKTEGGGAGEGPSPATDDTLRENVPPLPLLPFGHTAKFPSSCFAIESGIAAVL